MKRKEFFGNVLKSDSASRKSACPPLMLVYLNDVLLSGEEYPNLQFSVFGLLAVTAGLANLRLPETLGRPLPEDIRDMMLLGISCT